MKKKLLNYLNFCVKNFRFASVAGAVKRGGGGSATLAVGTDT